MLTKLEGKYRFRHERVHRFFVARHLDAMRESIPDLLKEVDRGSDGYWHDTLELWAEIWAQRVIAGDVAVTEYEAFILEVGRFDSKVLADRLIPQVWRLAGAGLIDRRDEFVTRALEMSIPRLRERFEIDGGQS